ncbi:MAG: SDR family oxidoreductase [Anaerolineae bacterium]|nr:SDR family oxidoreductase [Anaerolineae bacterium]
MTFREDALAGQHIVISGGAGAIGVAVTKALSDHGARVTVNDILPREEAVLRLEAAGVLKDRVQYIHADLTNHENVDQLLEQARVNFGPAHTLCCHAGMVQAAPIIEFDDGLWDQIMDVNLKAAYLLAKAGARAMLSDSVRGQIIFTTSWVGAVPWPDIAAYSASKAAMNMLMRSFSRELAAQGIRANAVAPGIVGAGMALRQWETEPDYRARASKAIPLGYLQPVESVADAFLFLCSPAASYMTGSILLVDGGCSLYPMD